MARTWCIPLAGLVLVATSLAATEAAPAAAQAPREPAAGQPARAAIHLIRPVAHGTRPLLILGSPHTALRSQNWSGYAAHGRTFRRVSASWVEPTGHCHGGRQFSSFWVGLDGFSSRTVEQTGSDVDCAGTSARYFAWYEMFPAFPVNFGNRVRPGDHFTASVTHTGGSRYTLVIVDTTEGWSHTIHKSLRAAKNSSAEVIAEAPSSNGGVLPLTDFGTVHFRDASVDGAAIGRARPAKIVMINHAGRRKDAVTALSGGRNFGVTWRHST